MVTSNLIMDKDLLRQIVPSQILGKVTKFGGLSSLVKKVMYVQSSCEQNPPPPLIV